MALINISDQSICLAAGGIMRFLGALFSIGIASAIVMIFLINFPKQFKSKNNVRSFLLIALLMTGLYFFVSALPLCGPCTPNTQDQPAAPAAPAPTPRQPPLR